MYRSPLSQRTLACFIFFCTLPGAQAWAAQLPDAPKENQQLARRPIPPWPDLLNLNHRLYNQLLLPKVRDLKNCLNRDIKALFRDMLAKLALPQGNEHYQKLFDTLRPDNPDENLKAIQTYLAEQGAGCFAAQPGKWNKKLPIVSMGLLVLMQGAQEYEKTLEGEIFGPVAFPCLRFSPNIDPEQYAVRYSRGVNFFYRKLTEVENNRKALIPNPATDFAPGGKKADDNHGISLDINPTRFNARNDEIYVISDLKAKLKLKQQGKNPGHFLMVPQEVMGTQEFTDLCKKTGILDCTSFFPVLQGLPEALADGDREAIVAALVEALT